ncbi:hypothetical protein AQUCO_02500298v1 [Aquilegia coerulea]|uniref:26S proteasome complex subunit SEM1 n=1 Tax=Aquilegia coerulea TaxID=218851 RepID=A0A2G5DAD2_AQUCA|nr:hypothetical protein AQUCO_02500298v1 [Aquilegia coerulea]
MATESKVAPTEETPKIDLFEDDDEFQEFEVNEECDDKEEGIDVTQQWEDDWDDDDVNDNISLQLRSELESNTEKKIVNSFSLISMHAQMPSTTSSSFKNSSIMLLQTF